MNFLYSRTFAQLPISLTNLEERKNLIGKSIYLQQKSPSIWHGWFLERTDSPLVNFNIAIRSTDIHGHDTISTNRSKNVNDLQTHPEERASWKNSARYRELTIHGQPPLWKYCFNSGHGFTRSLLSGRPPRFVAPRRYTSAWGDL